MHVPAPSGGIATRSCVKNHQSNKSIDNYSWNLCPTDLGIARTRRLLLAAAQANREGKPLPGLAAPEQHVRSCAIELPREQRFDQHARHGLFAPLDTDPVSV